MDNVVFFEENGDVFITSLQGEVIYEGEYEKEMLRRLKDGRWLLIHESSLEGQEDTAVLVTENDVIKMMIYNNQIGLLKQYFPAVYQKMLVE